MVLSGRREHLRRQWLADRRGSLDPADPQSAQRHGAGQPQRPHPDRRHRRAADPVGAGAQLAQNVQDVLAPTPVRPNAGQANEL